MSTIVEGPAAGNRLAELGVSASIIQQSLQAGYMEGAAYGRPHLPFVAGSVIWSAIGVRLFDLLASDGWQGEGVQNQFRVWNPATGIIIIPQRGDEGTGFSVPGIVPAQKNRKGAVTQRAVERNQPSLLEGLGGEGDIEAGTWILLYNFVEDGILAELSFPTKFAGRYVVEWGERIILPMFPYGGTGDQVDVPVDLPDDDEGIDFSVERRA